MTIEVLAVVCLTIVTLCAVAGTWGSTRLVASLDERWAKERAALIAGLLVREGDPAAAALVMAPTPRPDRDLEPREPTDESPVPVGDGWAFVGG